jgi:hypothetical protein
VSRFARSMRNSAGCGDDHGDGGGTPRCLVVVESFHRAVRRGTFFARERSVAAITDTLLVLSEIARVLKPVGRLLLTTPNYVGPTGCYRVHAPIRASPLSEGGQSANRVTLLLCALLWFARAGFGVTGID